MDSLRSVGVRRDLKFEGGVALADKSPNGAPVDELAECDPLISLVRCAWAGNPGGEICKHVFATDTDGW